MSNFKYFVFISTEKERECPHFDSLEEAIEKYNDVPMSNLKDSVFLGIESNSASPFDTDYVCFDVLHKFFEDNVLINDYLNHQQDSILEIVKEIINKTNIKYQFCSDVLEGVLIPFASDWVHENSEEEMKYEWNQLYLETFKEGNMFSVGWQPYTRETYENYGWNYPHTASYVGLMNVSYIDKSRVIHDRDVDIREYLAYHGKKFTDCREMK